MQQGAGGRCRCPRMPDAFARRRPGCVFSTPAKASPAVRPAVRPVAEAIAELRPGQSKGMRIRRDSGAQCGSGEFRAAAKAPGPAVEYIRAGAPGRAAA